MIASLHAHGEYSLLDGAGTARQHVEAAKAAGYSALALTDHGTLAGVLHHMRACREGGIMPIVGVEVYYRPNRKVQGQKEWLKVYYHLTLHAKDERGWRNLMLLVSESHRSGFYGRACVDDELLDKYHEGLLCLTGCIGGRLGKSIIAEHDREAEAWIRQLKRIFRDDLFVELMPHDLDEQRVVNVESARIAERHSLPVVATLDEHYPTAEWAPTQDILLMIATNQSLRKRQKKRDEGEDVYEFTVKTLYHQTEHQIRSEFAANHPGLSQQIVDESIRNTMVAASRITPFLVDQNDKMPAVTVPRDISPEDHLRRLAYEGLKARGYVTDPSYTSQLDFELESFAARGQTHYMLLVADIVSWCKSTRPVPHTVKGELVYDGFKKKPIMVGPGRGSASGSTVAWALGITNLNPKKYRLLFERFVNPSRVGLPDIDLDFAPDRVDEVESYVKAVHGKDNVVDIIAHSTFGPRAALTDVGRVLNIPYDRVKGVTKTIDDQERGALDDLLKVNKGLEDYARDYPFAYDQSRRVQGMVARKSEHAGGLLILPRHDAQGRPTKLDDYIPVERTGGQKGKLLSAFGERSGKGNALISDYGYVKIDVLRVAELRKQQHAVDLIAQRTGKVIDLDDLAVHDDPYAVDDNVMQGFKDGLLVGIFQFSATAQKLTRQIKPDNILELAAINALIRPGPRGAGSDQRFHRRKNGHDPVVYWHSSLEPFLDYTFGELVFQEQLVELVASLGGMSRADADIFRKIASKLYRDPDYAREVMGEWEVPIKAAFAKNHINDDESDIIWRNLLSFSDYSFNLCMSGDTVVERGGAGGKGRQPAKITVADLYHAQESKTAWGSKIRDPKRGVSLLQMDPDGRIRPGKMRRVHYVGRKNLFLITTSSGKSIKVTKEHRLLTDSGYVEASELLVGSSLVVEMPREEYGDQYYTGRTRGHASGVSYVGQGFQDGAANPSWLDGRTKLLNESKAKVRSRPFCQLCFTKNTGDVGGGHEFEAAHIMSLEACGGDYMIFHAIENLCLLCNSCHKKLDYAKGERKKRWSVGRPTGLDYITSIENVGEEDVFDIEMATVEHNFVANGVVSHNSHASGYALLAYRDMWLKVSYPREFYAAFLSKGLSAITKKKALQKQETAREMRALPTYITVKPFMIMPPDIHESGRDYTVVEDGIRLGLEAIKNIGPAAASAIEEHRPFASYEDFVARVPARAVNITGKASLVMAGAFDRWGKRNQFTEDKIDELERDLIGMSLTSVHSIQRYASVIDGRFWSEDEVDASPDGTRVTITGEVTGIKEIVDKKALAHGTPVLTPDGYVSIEDLVVGDLVVGSDGLPTSVIGIWPQGICRLYEVELHDGTKIRCDGDHLWSVTCSDWLHKGLGYRVKKTSDLSNSSRTLRLPLPTGQVMFASRPDPDIDSWLIGALLGDGWLSRQIGIVCAEEEMVQRVNETLPNDCELKFNGRYHYSVRGRNVIRVGRGQGHPGLPSHSLMKWVKKVGLKGKRSWEKRVPEEVLWGSPEVRLACLQGLADTDGAVMRIARAAICTVSPGMAEDIKHLVVSLGGSYKVYEQKTYRRLAYNVSFHIPGVTPFRLTRKAKRYEDELASRHESRDWRKIKSIIEVDSGEATCITVAADNGMFMTTNMTLTHNSNTMAFVDLAYGPNQWSCTMFSYLWAEYEELVKSRRPLLITGVVDTYDKTGRRSIKVESLPPDADGDFVPPVLDLGDFVSMLADIDESQAADSVYQEDLEELRQEEAATHGSSLDVLHQ